MTWWRRLFSRDRLDSELDRELSDHIERQVAEFVRGGMTEGEARRRARLSFGGDVQIAEACRDARGTRWVEDIVQDIRYSIRILLRSPAFALVAILSLALGIGANTAIFSIVNSLLLRSLPVRAPEQLVILEGGSWTNPIWEQIRDHHAGLFGGAAAWGEDRFDLASGGVSNSVDGLWTSGNFFDVLGTPAILGRTFGPDDDRRGGGPAWPAIAGMAKSSRRATRRAGQGLRWRWPSTRCALPILPERLVPSPGCGSRTRRRAGWGDGPMAPAFPPNCATV